MGESPKLSLEEQVEFTLHVLKRVDGRVPVVVGVSNPGMDNLETLSRTTMDQGAGGVMIAGIPGLKTDEQVETYFKAVSDRLGEEIPICLQDYPPTTTVFISVGVVNRLIAEIPHLRMFKHEDCPGHRKLTRLRQAPETDGTRRVSILTGNNGLYVPQELARGADGIMTGFAFPGMLVDVYSRFQSGKAEEAEDLFDLYLPILRHEQQFGFGLALRKETLRRRGAIASAKARDPGPRMDARDHAEMDGLLGRLRRKLVDAGHRLPPGL
jgi:4-hydroxy-tetrahydrodipicolinate synthase